METMKHRPPSAIRLRLECDGDVTETTWGEFLQANRHDRDVWRAVWRVVTREVSEIAVGGGVSPLVVVRLAESEVTGGRPHETID